MVLCCAMYIRCPAAWESELSLDIATPTRVRDGLERRAVGPRTFTKANVGRAKLPSGSIETIVLQEIAENLESAGIELQMYHGEAAPGQVSASIGQANVIAYELVYSTR